MHILIPGHYMGGEIDWYGTSHVLACQMDCLRQMDIKSTHLYMGREKDGYGIGSWYSKYDPEAIQ